MAKRFRLLRRNDDGSAVHESNDADGYTLLSIAKDGSRYMHTVGGICGDCLQGRHTRAECPWRDPGKPLSPEPEPVGWVQGVEILKAQPAPYVQPPYVPEPGPVKPKRRVVKSEPAVDRETEEAAKTIAIAVRSRSVMSRADLYQGRNPAQIDQYLSHAVAMEWVVAGLNLITPGRVDPRPVTPIGDVDGPSWGQNGSSDPPSSG